MRQLGMFCLAVGLICSLTLTLSASEKESVGTVCYHWSSDRYDPLYNAICHTEPQPDKHKGKQPDEQPGPTLFGGFSTTSDLTFQSQCYRWSSDCHGMVCNAICHGEPEPAGNDRMQTSPDVPTFREPKSEIVVTGQFGPVYIRESEIGLAADILLSSEYPLMPGCEAFDTETFGRVFICVFRVGDSLQVTVGRSDVIPLSTARQNLGLGGAPASHSSRSADLNAPIIGSIPPCGSGECFIYLGSADGNTFTCDPCPHSDQH